MERKSKYNVRVYCNLFVSEESGQVSSGGDYPKKAGFFRVGFERLTIKIRRVCVMTMGGQMKQVWQSLTAEILVYICSKNPPHRQAAARWWQP